MKQVIIIDIETTGFSPSNSQITGIAAVKICGVILNTIDSFTSLVKIDGIIPWRITKLTGITDQMLYSKGRSVRKVIQELSNFCGNLNIYAHNSPFDKRFIRQVLSDCDTEFIESKWIDTVDIFKRKLPGMKNYKLETLIIHFGLAKKESHRALDDVKHTI